MSNDLADLADHVMSQLQTSFTTDDERRPWLHTELKQGRGQLCMGIQHFGGRAMWVLKHGDDGAHEIRFALSDERFAVNLFFKAARYATSYAQFRLVHADKDLLVANVKVNDVTEFQDVNDHDVQHMIGIIKRVV